MEFNFQKTKDVYNNKSISIEAKLQHYKAVIRPESLYASECLVLNKKGEIENMEKKERKILRKILGPKKTEEGYRLKSNAEIYLNMEKLSDVMRKRRLAFYGHLARMDEKRLTRKIFEHSNQREKTNNKWIQMVRKDMSAANIIQDAIWDREKFRQLVNKVKEFPEEAKESNVNRRWTDERRKHHAEVMRKYWV